MKKMNIKPFEILEHTGDVKIRVFGKTKEEWFLNAMGGMNEILKATGNREQGIVRRNIKIQSTDINALLVDFLSEINYLRQVNMEMYDKARFTRFSDTHSTGSGQAELEAEIEGWEVEEFGEDIKAVTFHDLDIQKDKEGICTTNIIFDV